MENATMRGLGVLRPWQSKGVLIALLIAVSTGTAWVRSVTGNAAETTPMRVATTHYDLKPALIGSYEVTGTDPDGTPYAAPGILDITLTPSGALELEWDNGRNVGIGQVIGNILAVASLTSGRTINSDHGH